MNLQVKTTDNSSVDVSAIADGHLDNLKKLSERPLCELNLEEHPNLLVFPQDFKTHGDDIGKDHIFTIDSNLLKTGNLMGFVGYRNTKVRISSRFAHDDKDYFLHYMLQKVFAINLFDLKYDSDSEGVFGFLIYLFPTFLKRAMRQGLYKEYQTRDYNDANIRGRIDVSRHIRQNIPFAGKVAYSTREYVSDNRITQLVRHTIEYIATHPFSGNILNNDDETKEAVGVINAATSTYNRNDRQKVIYQNLRPVYHPYFGEYRPLQRLCLQILRHEELKYGNDDNQIYGILFDGAWLWEEYLDTILKPIGLIHPHNRTNNVGKHIFKAPRKVLVQPDFFIDGLAVFDAKYKRHKSLFDIEQREDRFQLLAYMHVFNAKVSGLIVPVSSSEPLFIEGEISGRGGVMVLLGMNVGKQCQSFDNFVIEMKKEEWRLLEYVRELVSEHSD